MELNEAIVKVAHDMIEQCPGEWDLEEACTVDEAYMTLTADEVNSWSPETITSDMREAYLTILTVSRDDLRQAATSVNWEAQR
jgi:hypothetical protein